MMNLDRIVNKVMDRRKRLLISGRTGVTFLIEPVSKCNLACKYCAADGWKPGEKFDVISKKVLDEYLEKIADFITRYDTRAEILMHGYEPLMAGIELFEYVQDKVKELGIKDRVRFGVQTNGTLVNEEWARFFVKNDWGVGFSLDGPREYHDANRVFRNGSGSYYLAIRGYRIYKEISGKPPGVISTITSVYRRPSLEESVERYYNWMLENGMKSVILHMAAVDPRNPNSKEFAMTNDEYAKWFILMYDKWANSNDGIDLKPFSQIVEAMVRGVARFGACSFRNGCWRVVSIDYKGQLHLCDRWSYVGGHISQYKTLDEFMFNSRIMKIQALRPYMLRKFDRECSKCKYFQICQGGCTNEGIYNYYMTREGIRNIPQWTRTQFCNAYKQIFAHIERDLESRGIELGFKKLRLRFRY